MILSPAESIRFNTKPKKLIYCISSQTNEFGFEMAKTIPLSNGFGAILYEINEFSSFFKTKNKYEEKFLASLLTAYDGDFEKRNVKSEDSEETLEDIGVNVAIFTDFTDLQGIILTELLNYLKKGFLRRFIITFTNHKTKLFSDLTLAETEKLNNKLIEIGDKIFSVFTQIEPNAVYIITEEAYNVHKEYARELCEYANSLDNDLLELEVNSRAYKALRLSGIYAPLNHPKDLCITKEDMLQAVSSVEFLSQEFKAFMNYKPRLDDVHDKILNFLNEHIGEEFSKGHFTKNSRDFGVSREKMAKNFENYMKTIEEITDDNYTLIIRDNQRKNGYKYKLIKTEEKPLSGDILDITEVIPLDKHSVLANSTESLESTDNENLRNILNLPKDTVIEIKED